MCEQNTINVCNGISRFKKCRTELINNGVNDSGFCEACWYPNINEDYDNFKYLKEEGYSREAAGIISGIFDPVEEPNDKIKNSIIKTHGNKKRY